MRTKITVNWKPGIIRFDGCDRLLTLSNSEMNAVAVVRELPSGIAYIQSDVSMDGRYGVIPECEHYHVLDVAQRVFEAYPVERIVIPGKLV